MSLVVDFGRAVARVIEAVLPARRQVTLASGRQFRHIWFYGRCCCPLGRVHKLALAALYTSLMDDIRQPPNRSRGVPLDQAIYA
jgi:hypothetical protein